MDGPWTLVPPLLAIVLAIATRRIYTSLAVGVAAGALIHSSGNPLASITLFFEGLLWPAIGNEDHLRVFAFTLLMGAMVGVIRVSGGMEGAVEAMSRFATTRKRAGLLTWIMGMVIFFDDYANTLLLGTSMRPLADRLRISREKLAYIVDSTAAPVAGLALVSTWIAGEIGYIANGLTGLEFAGQAPDAFGLFVASIPYRFYVIWALLLVPLTILLGREFGPMAKAEQRAIDGTQVSADDTPVTKTDDSTANAPPRHWIYAALPVLVVICLTTLLLWTTGVSNIQAKAKADAETTAIVEAPPAIDLSLRNIIGKSNSYVALVYGSLAGLVVALLMTLFTKDIRLTEIRAATMSGASMMLPALAILTLAWALSAVTDEDHLNTGAYLGTWITSTISAAWLPTIVFLLASIVAFCTGSSWGTMGILVPLAVQSTFKALAAEGTVDAYDPIFLATIGSVLAGSIFGDHCSPISDTTVLSSQASGCDHIAHVSTQLPYALLVGGVAILFGTIPIGFGVSVWAMLPIGMLAVVAGLWFAGRPIVDRLSDQPQ